MCSSCPPRPASWRTDASRSICKPGSTRRTGTRPWYAGLAHYLGLKLSTMSPAARHRYAQRTSLFHAEPEEGTVLEVHFGQGHQRTSSSCPPATRAAAPSFAPRWRSSRSAPRPPGCAFTLGWPSRRGASKGARCWCRHRTLGHLRHRRHGEEHRGAQPAADAAQHLRPRLQGGAGHGGALPKSGAQSADTLALPFVSARSSCCRRWPASCAMPAFRRAACTCARARPGAP